MSHLHVTLPVVPTDMKNGIIKNLTETLGNITGTAYENITVLLDTYYPDSAGRGGLPLAEHGGLLLHIDVYSPLLRHAEREHLAEHLTNALADSMQLPPGAREHIFITFHQFSVEHMADHGHLAISPN